MASLNVQILKVFSRIYTFFEATTPKNLAQLRIDRFQNVICNGLPCQVFQIKMWPISRASNVLLEARLRLPDNLACGRWQQSIFDEARFIVAYCQ
jgi:hypothetical protein